MKPFIIPDLLGLTHPDPASGPLRFKDSGEPVLAQVVNLAQGGCGGWRWAQPDPPKGPAPCLRPQGLWCGRSPPALWLSGPGSPETPSLGLRSLEQMVSMSNVWY